MTVGCPSQRKIIFRDFKEVERHRLFQRYHDYKKKIIINLIHFFVCFVVVIVVVIFLCIFLRLYLRLCKFVVFFLF